MMKQQEEWRLLREIYLRVIGDGESKLYHETGSSFSTTPSIWAHLYRRISTDPEKLVADSIADGRLVETGE